MVIYTHKNFPYDIAGKAGAQTAPKGRKRRTVYKDLICAFDIETTRIVDIDHSVMYVWQFAMMSDGKIYVCMGRTWAEYQALIAKLTRQVGVEKIVVWVHNLAYEFQFLSGIFDFSADDVFCLDRRKVVRAETGNVEYRCSYRQTNMSLDEFTRRMNVPMPKAAPIDYTIARYPWTTLTDDEIDYCIRDVVGLVQAMAKRMAIDGDNLHTVPMTSTGYVRRDTKKAMEFFPRCIVTDSQPDLEIWQVCREAFRGGNTHANRYYASNAEPVIIRNVVSYDRSSSYPDVICNDLFPMGKFRKDKNTSLEHVTDLLKRGKRAMLMRIALSNVTLRDEMWGCPYLTLDKCRNKRETVNDNGRVVSAAYLETTVTDVDFKILADEYNWDGMNIIDLYHARYEQLPQPIRDLTVKYYRDKTYLKGDEEQQIYYDKAKALLNSIYGMMAQNPVKKSYLYTNGEYVVSEDKTDQELLNIFNAHSCLSYAWGVWVTAWARYRLEEGIKIAGDRFVYADTDSVKYIDGGETDFDAYNAARRKASERNGAIAEDRNGKKYYMGVFEKDAEYKTFVTYGAKKYAYEDKNGLHITIAGVGKKLGASELEKNGGLSALRTGFVFSEAGGMESVYNDTVENPDLYIDGHWLRITKNVCLRPSTYTLGVTDEYFDIIENGKYVIDSLQNLY